jgi:hypothetical protein
VVVQGWDRAIQAAYGSTIIANGVTARDSSMGFPSLYGSAIQAQEGRSENMGRPAPELLLAADGGAGAVLGRPPGGGASADGAVAALLYSGPRTPLALFAEGGFALRPVDRCAGARADGAGAALRLGGALAPRSGPWVVLGGELVAVSAPAGAQAAVCAPSMGEAARFGEGPDVTPWVARGRVVGALGGVAPSRSAPPCPRWAPSPSCWRSGPRPVR